METLSEASVRLQELVGLKQTNVVELDEEENPLNAKPCLRSALSFAFEALGVLEANGLGDEVKPIVDYVLALWARRIEWEYLDGLAVKASNKRLDFVEYAIREPDKAVELLAAIESEDCETVREAVLLLADRLGLEKETLTELSKVLEDSDCSKVRALGVALVLVPPRAE